MRMAFCHYMTRSMRRRRNTNQRECCLSRTDPVTDEVVRSYRGEAKQMYRWLGSTKVVELTVADVNAWMADMTAGGYAPKSVGKPFRLLKQALKWGMAQVLLSRNVCEFRKPIKRVKTSINALSREGRSRMPALAKQPSLSPSASR